MTITSLRSETQPFVSGLSQVLTPALIIYPRIVDHNIAATIGLLNGRAERWRPHIKTAKLETTIRQYVEHGVRQFKCATTLELVMACSSGAEDVLVAYPSIGPRVRRIREIAEQYPKVNISVIVENARDLEAWRGCKVGLFIDLNPGMDRTGLDLWNTKPVVELAEKIRSQGLRFRGLHYYDGHHRQEDIEERKAAAFPGYEQLVSLVEVLRHSGIPVGEVVTSGTPGLPCALAFSGFKAAEINHQVSAGTVVYNDLTSLSQLPANWGYKLATLVASIVISHPAPGVVTCDAGHKCISVDRGFPHCSVVGRPELVPLHPSEEHLPIRVPAGHPVPAVGEVLYFAPTHVCTTVNNFDQAILVEGEKITGVVPVTARGHDSPCLGERFALS